MSAKGFLLLLLAALLSGCAGKKKEVVEFPRPPAVVTVSVSEPVVLERRPDEGEIVEDALPAAAESARSDEKQPANPSPTPSRRRTVRPAEPELAAEPEPTPPPTPSLRPAFQPEPSAIRDKLGQARMLLGSLGGRSLSSEQQQQARASRTFIEQADRALDEGDIRRAAILADKGLILAEDLARSNP